jgi:flagellar protein FlbD
MIQLHKLTGSPVTINANLIETLESSPDTVVFLTSGNRIVVKESVAQVVEKVVEYHRRVWAWRQGEAPAIIDVPKT